MASPYAIYQYRGDNVASLATITIQTGSDPGDSNYEPASLVDENPAKVAKINSTTGAWLFDFGSAQRIDIAALIHHDFDAGADVKLQGNATNSWGAPTLSASFTIPAWIATGTSQRWPVNPWMDVTTATNYTTSGFRYWRLVITSNSQNLQLGEIWLGSSIRRFTRNIQWGLVRTQSIPTINNVTAFGIATTYPRGTTRRQYVASSVPSDVMATDLYAQFQSVGGNAYPWLFIMDGTVNDACLVRWLTTEQQMTAIAPNIWGMPLSIQEVGRGLRPGT